MMNQIDQIYAKKIGSLVSTIRKLKGLNQKQMADLLQSTQSTISKIEDGKSILTAAQWYFLCSRLNISSDALEFGKVDDLIPARFQKRFDNLVLNYKLPKKYKINSTVTVRGMAPLTELLKEKIDKAFTEDLKFLGVDEDYFGKLDHLIGGNFLIDLYETIFRKNEKYLKDAFSPRYFNTQNVHGALYRDLNKIEEPERRLHFYASKSALYDCSFKRTLKKESKNKFLLSISAEKHFTDVLKKGLPPFAKFIDGYIYGFANAICNSIHGEQAELEALDELTENSFLCNYRLTTN